MGGASDGQPWNTDRRTRSVPIGMHRPWRDFCVYRSTFTPSQRAVAGVQKRDSLLSRPLCPPPSGPSPSLRRTSVPGPFFPAVSVPASNSPGIGRLTLRALSFSLSSRDAPGAEFLRWQKFATDNNGWVNGSKESCDSVRFDFRNFL